MSAISIVGAIPQLSLASSVNTGFYMLISATISIVSLVLFALFWPGLFATARFIYRVSKIYGQQSFVEAVSAFNVNSRNKVM